MVIIEKQKAAIDPKTADWVTLTEYTIRTDPEEQDIFGERLRFLQGDLEKMGIKVRYWKPDAEHQPKPDSQRSRKSVRRR